MSNQVVIYQDRNLLSSPKTVVLAEISPGHVARAELSNVTPGFRTLNNTKYIPTPEEASIDSQVKPVEKVREGLESISLYRRAEEVITIRDEEGRTTKPLRYGLIEGFAGLVGVPESEIQSIIYKKDNGDLTESQYTGISERVYNILQDAKATDEIQGDVVTAKTIRNEWLTGETFFPSNWEQLKVLAQYSPQLAKCYDDYAHFEPVKEQIKSIIRIKNKLYIEDFYSALRLDTSSPSIFGCYLFYKGVRSVEARLSEKPKKEGSGTPAPRRSDDTLFNYAEITEYLVNYYRTDITKDVSLELVLENKRASGQSSQTKKIPHETFSRGFYRGEVPAELKVISTNDVYTAMSLLNIILVKWKEKYVYHKSKQLLGNVGYEKVTGLMQDIIILESRPHTNQAQNLLQKLLSSLTQDEKQKYAVLKNSIKLGIEKCEPDSYTGVSEGTYNKLIRTYTHLTLFMPSNFFGMTDSSAVTNFRILERGFMTRQDRRQRDSMDQKLRDDCKRRFNFDKDTAKLDIESYLKIFIEDPEIRLGNRDPQSKSNYEIALLTAQTVKAIHPDRFVTYSESTKILEIYGLGNLSKLLDKDLYRRIGLYDLPEISILSP